MKTKNIILSVVSLTVLILPTVRLYAETAPATSSASSSFAAPVASNNKFSGSMTLEPLQYTEVNGDKHKFQELNWSKEGYNGGIQDFEFEEHNTPTDLHATVDGHAIPNNNDYEVNALIEKKNFGYTKLEYEEFSKYYDDTGSVYAPFTTLTSNDLGRQLEMEIGHFRVETGLTIEDFPEISFAYDRHFKDGAKSRLTWAPVLVGSVTRNIAPSFQYVNEVVHSVELNESHTINGFELKGQQAFEWSEADLNRFEQSLTNTTTASAAKIRQQDQDVSYRLFTTTESVEKWFKDETVFAGTAYHFMHLTNDEIENIFETNRDGVLTNFSNPKNVRNARADNEYNDHAMTGNFMFTPLKWLNVITNVKSELMDRTSTSNYPQDTTPAAAGGSIPDGVINNIDVSRVEDKAAKIGEGLSLRITAIPRTAIYNDFEFEQVRNWLGEDRDSLAGQSTPNAGEIYGRETISKMSRGIWTLGFQTLPLNWLNWTSHFRVNRANTDYEDKRETGDTASAAKSAFIDGFDTMSHEYATRMTFKVKPWLKPSVRYHYKIMNYYATAELMNEEHGATRSHVFTFDVTLQPLHNLMIVAAMAPQYSSVFTVANQFGNPTFHGDVLSWYLNATYDFNEKISLLSGINYSHANNFNDFATIGLPQGQGYTQTDIMTGINWKLSERVSILTSYNFAYYNGDDDIDSARYHGHMISSQTKFSWG